MECLRKPRKAIEFFLVSIFLISSSAFAQQKITPTVKVQLTRDGITKWWEPLPVKRRTADSRWIASTVTSFAFTAGDVENSLVALRSSGTIEANGIYGSHPSRAKYYAISIPAAIGMAWFSYHYKREDDALADAGIRGHKYAKWWLPNAINTGAHAIGILVTVSSTHK